MNGTRGLSLLETIVALFILTTTVWSAGLLYVGLMRGAQTGEARRHALSTAETALQVWREKGKEPWPEDFGLEPIEGVYHDYVYRVEIGDPLRNPTFNASVPGSPEYLDVRVLSITLLYDEENRPKEIVLHGSLAK